MDWLLLFLCRRAWCSHQEDRQGGHSNHDQRESGGRIQRGRTNRRVQEVRIGLQDKAPIVCNTLTPPHREAPWRTLAFRFQTHQSLSDRSSFLPLSAATQRGHITRVDRYLLQRCTRDKSVLCPLVFLSKRNILLLFSQFSCLLATWAFLLGLRKQHESSTL